jgi:hypothetical protein
MTTTMKTIRRVSPAIFTEGWRAIFWLAAAATFPGLHRKHLLRHRCRGGLRVIREDGAGSGIFSFSAGGAGREAGVCL